MIDRESRVAWRMVCSACVGLEGFWCGMAVVSGVDTEGVENTTFSCCRRAVQIMLDAESRLMIGRTISQMKRSWPVEGTLIYGVRGERSRACSMLNE